VAEELAKSERSPVMGDIEVQNLPRCESMQTCLWSRKQQRLFIMKVSEPEITTVTDLTDNENLLIVCNLELQVQQRTETEFYIYS
jgi:hypothetical protein